MTLIYHHCSVFRYVFMRAEFIFLFFINIVLVGISNQIDIPPQNPKFHIPNLRRLYFLGFRVCRVYPNENGAGEKTALNILLVSSLYALKSRPVWLSFQCVCTSAHVCVSHPFKVSFSSSVKHTCLMSIFFIFCIMCVTDRRFPCRDTASLQRLIHLYLFKNKVVQTENKKSHN